MFLLVKVIDAHCHLDFKHFNKDRMDVIERARASGVVEMINSGVDLQTNRETLKLARSHEFIHATLGLSPNSLDQMRPKDVDLVLDEIRQSSGR